MKKLLSLFLVVLFSCLNFLPVFADSVTKIDKYGNSEVIEPSSVITLIFNQDFNVNESYVGQELVFNLAKAIKDSDSETVLPVGTQFVGYVEQKENSKWGFRKASANIIINKMVLPDGRIYSIQSQPEKGTLSSPTSLNIAKGVGESAIAAGVCVFGAVVVAIECMSIGGIILAPYTGAAMGVAIGVTSKGLNYKLSAGTPINIVLQSPVNIEMH